eukprot:29135-Alexandrium_andersonii.AAC.1
MGSLGDFNCLRHIQGPRATLLAAGPCQGHGCSGSDVLSSSTISSFSLLGKQLDLRLRASE